MAEPKAPYGERMLPTYLAQLAHADPDRVLYNVPKDRKSYVNGVEKINAKQFGQMIDRMAWFLQGKLGKCSHIETLAYIGPNDIRYFIVWVAMNKVGYNAMFISPRNSVSNHLHLLEKTDCSVILKASTSNVDQIVEMSPNQIRVIDVPELDALTGEDHVPTYPFDRAFDEAKHDPSLILHSSGSTGQVKPIQYTYRSLAALDLLRELRDETGTSAVVAALPGKNMFVGMPFYHSGGVYMGFLFPIWYNFATTLYPWDSPISTDRIIETIKLRQPDMAVLAPSTLEEAAYSDEALQALSTLKLVIFGGGAINEREAEKIAQHVNLQSYIGSTEAGAYPIYPHTDYKADFAYFKFQPGDPGVEFRHKVDDLYELVVVRHNGIQYQPIWDAFPDKIEYPTSDLFRPHPTKPGYWRHAGRLDDVIVLSNGEKVVPSLTEKILGEAPHVRGVLLYGQKRFEVAALIELEPGAESISRDDLLKTLDPYLKRANAEVPQHAQLSKDYVIFSKADKPFVRLPKGTVARKPTLNLYSMEIDEVYSDNDNIKTIDKPLVKGVTEDETADLLALTISDLSDMDNLTTEQDFFQTGIDSLRVITIVRLIRSQLRREDPQVPLEKINTALVYANPTAKRLARAIRDLGSSKGTEDEHKVHIENVKQMISKYSEDLPEVATIATKSKQEEMSIILTGSTGSLGAYLLDTLLSDKRVVRIFSLNRSADGRQKQEQSNSSRDLSINWGDRVHFLQADLSKPFFGLEENMYQRIVDTTTHIIHNQWPVNFNLPLSTFEPHILGVRNLINLAAVAPNRPSILFVSSVGVIKNWSALKPGILAPEAELTDIRVPLGIAYAESKFISEELLVAAAKNSGVNSIVVRVGQLAGSVDKKSVWNKVEWFPSLIASSKYLGAVPDSLGSMSNVDFVPVDRAAEVIHELATSKDISNGERTEAYFVNMVNPTPVPYSDLVPTIVESLKPNPRVVSIKEWFSELKRSSEDPNLDLDSNPAVKLLGFFKGLASGGEKGGIEATKTIETAQIEKLSLSMRELEAVKPVWMEAWIKGFHL